MSGRSIQLIDRDELLATLEQDINVSVTGEENMEAVRRCLQEILDDVKESPVVDAVPVKHGKWISHGDCGVTECSCCGWNIEECVGWNYCPNCGARMDDHGTD
jgi:hypothetical protein